MKLIILLIINLMYFITLYAFQISKIKVTGNTFTKTETILNFAPELNYTKDYSIEEITGLLKRIKERLVISGWFYDVNIYITSSSESENKKNIIMEVSDGFLYRFGGGQAYGVFGMENVLGNGEYYYASLGYNKQMLQAGTKFLTKDLFIDLSAGNFPSNFYTNNMKYETQNIGGKLEFGCRINYDFRVSLINSVGYLYNSSYNYLDALYLPGVRVIFDKKKGVFSSPEGCFLQADYLYNISLGGHTPPFSRLEAFGAGYCPLLYYDEQNSSLYIAAKIGIKYQNSDNKPDSMKLSLAGIDGIRNNNIGDLTGNSSVESHLELRWDFFETIFLGIFNISFETLLFTDAGEILDNDPNFKLNNIQYAFGTGLRIFFGMPVNIPLRLETGWDGKGGFSFFIDTSGPF